MFSSSELIEAVRRRLRLGRSIRPLPPPGQMPPGWDDWAARAPGRAAPLAVVAEELVGVLLPRTPVFPTGYRRLNRWQAFLRLWRQDWRERPTPDRRTRAVSMSASLLLHVLWLQLMILFMVARPPSADAEAARLGENITQVEFIGEGTPAEEGGGSQQAEQAEPSVAASAAPAAAASAASPEAAPPMPPPAVAEVEPPTQEQVPPPVAEQPLQVTETAEPDGDFIIAMPTLDAPPVPPLPSPQLQAPTPEIRVVEVPVVTPPPELRPLPRRELSVPDLRQREVEITERAVSTPAPEVALRVPRAPLPTPAIDRDATGPAERAIELRTPSPVAGSADRPADGRAQGAPAVTGQAATSSSTRAGGTRASGQGATPSAATAGAGPASRPAPGGLPSPRAGDDWGDSTRNVPGGQAGSPSGLFNADGTARLAGNTGKAGGGLPPGTITEDYEKIDRMGTWLKRPPVGYEPTALDRFWVPHETLLEEWVRRSIKEVLIPIPGTGKRIKCTVAMLMLGGACGISDPNMLDIEAEARKPPDVPFKRELQEDQGSLGPAVP